jgi:hypothetical protein
LPALLKRLARLDILDQRILLLQSKARKLPPELARSINTGRRTVRIRVGLSHSRHCPACAYSNNSSVVNRNIAGTRLHSGCPMTHMDLSSRCNRSKLRLTVCLFAIMTATGSLVAEQSHAEMDRRGGEVGRDAGLTLALTADATGTKYYASLRNDGAKPLFLVLGTITANDKWICPSRIELLITGPDRKTHRSPSSVGCDPSGGIAGRMDPFIIPLVAAASYAFPVLDLNGAPAGHYIIKATYTGVSVSLRSCNGDMQGLSLIHYWTGAVESSTTTVAIR